MSPNSETIIKHLTKLVSFDTTNPPRKIKESGIVEYLEEVLVGAEISVTDYGNGSINVLAVKGEPKYLFNYHIDTVPVTAGWSSDPFDLRKNDGKLFGLGACDIKGAAACMLACIEAGADNYAVLFSSDEEHGSSLCVRSFLKDKHNFEGVVVAEPTNAKAVLAHRGIITATMMFCAESGHSSESRALKDNANHQAAKWIVDAIDWAAGQLAKSYQGLSGTCFNVGRVEGGIKPNIIAPKAEIKFGLRPLPGKQPDKVLSQLLGNCNVSASSEVSIGFKAPSLPATINFEQNQDLAQDLGLPIGEPVNFWTEASLFSESGYAAIVYGPGSISQAHTADEWVSISDLEQVANQYWRILSHGS